MKKRWIAWVLTVAMCLSMFPVDVLAADEEDTENGEIIFSEKENAEPTPEQESDGTNDGENTTPPQENGTEPAENVGAAVLAVPGEDGQTEDLTAGEGVPETETVENGADSSEIVASGECGDDLTWTLDEDGVLTISGTGDMWDYEYEARPGWYNSLHLITALELGEGITHIGSKAFESCYLLTSVTLPDSVKSIGRDAFAACFALTNVKLNAGLESIGDVAFCSCESLTAIHFPASLRSIGMWVFEGCTVLTNISYGGTMEQWAQVEQGNNAFGYLTCTDGAIVPSGECGDDLTWTLDEDGTLTISGTGDMWDWGESDEIMYFYTDAPWSIYEIQSVEIREGVTSIGRNAFDRSSLRSVVLPDSITEIGKEAFRACCRLEEISLPKNVSVIGSGAFAGCTAVTAFTVSSDNEAYRSVDGVLYNKDQTELVAYPAGKTGSFSVPEGVVRIGDYAFNESRADRITLPQSVESFGRAAFSRASLESIALPDGITEVSDYMFEGCYYLRNVTLPDTIVRIGEDAFYGCGTLEGITLPAGLTSIDSYAFYDCPSLREITLPASLTDGDNIFLWCYGLTAVYVDGSNTAYSSVDGVLYNKEQTELIYIPEGIVGEITIPAGVVTVPDNAFEEHTGLTAIHVDGSNTAYSSVDGILYNKAQTRLICCPIGKSGTVVVPAGVTGIDYGAFTCCGQLTGITLQEGITELFGGVFYGCSAMTSITIPESVTHIDADAFAECSSLTDVFYNGSEARWNLIPNADQCEELSAAVIHFGREKGYEVASGVCGDNLTWTLNDSGVLTVSGTGAMWDYGYCDDGKWHDAPWLNLAVRSAVLESGVTSIGNFAFSNCWTLAEVDLPETVTRIGNYAFACCVMLTEIVLPEGLARLAGYAFMACSGLEKVTLPDSLPLIDCFVFGYCNSLKEIHFCGSEARWNSLVINEGNDSLLNAEVTFGRENGYEVASGVCGDDLTWTLNDSGVLTVSGTGDMWDYEYEARPGWYNSLHLITALELGEGITHIGSKAFESCYLLTSVTLPDSVKSIGDYAFYCCSSLTSVTIPNSVTSIGDRAFGYCGSLTNITVADGNQTYSSVDGVLFNKNQTTLICCPGGISGSYVIPNSVTYIGDKAFYYCSGLTSVTIPNSVTSIGSDAFYDCSGLTSVTIPNSVTSIGDYAFYRCSNLTSVTIPEGVTSIGSFAFGLCGSLMDVYYGGSEARWNSLVINEGNDSLLNAEITFARENGYEVASGECGDDLTWTLNEDGVLTISGTGDMWDYGCEDRTALAGDWISTPWVEYGYKDMISAVVVEEGVTGIGNGAFAFASVKSAALPETLKTIGYDAFNGAELSTVTIPEGVTRIGGGAFLGTKLEEFVFPDGVTTIEDNVLSICESLRSVTLPEGAKTIEDGAFFGCSALEELEIPDSVTAIGCAAFLRSGLKTIEIPDSVTTLGDNRTTHGYYTHVWPSTSQFGLARSLSEVTLGSGITVIGVGMFENCAALEGIVLPESVTAIEADAFRSSGLRTLAIPASVSRIDATAFADCTDLTGITVDEANPCFVSDDRGVLYTADGKTLVWAPRTLSGTYTVPAGVTAIGNGAFYGCTALTEIILPEGLTSIGREALFCSINTTVNLPSTLTFIGERAFCASFTELTVPARVTELNEEAFAACTELTSATIPVSVKQICHSAFGTYQKDLYYQGTENQWNQVRLGCCEYWSAPEMGYRFGESEGWEGNDLLAYATLHFAEESAAEIIASGECGNDLTWTLTAEGKLTVSGTGEMTDYTYSFQSPWSGYTVKCAVVGEGVTSIGSNAFYDCSGLTSVTIPNSVTSIGSWAFYYCGSLTSVTIGNSVTSIGDYAFFRCSSLTSVTIPNSVTSIGSDAFEYCGSLTSVTIPNSVTSIGDYAFYDCSGLTSVTIGNSVTSIGYGAFEWCSSLTSVTIPNSVTYIGSYAFGYCGSLTNITVADGNQTYSSVDGVLFNKNQTALICCPGGISGSYVIPNSVTSIRNGAFKRCSSLTSVTIPEGVTSIGSWAFDECSSLMDVYYGGTETEWNSVAIANGNSCLTSAKIHFTHFHISDGGVVTTAPTCTETGTMTYSCIDCDEIISTEVIPATGHSFSDEWSRDADFHWHSAVCEHTDEIVEKAAHAYGEWAEVDEHTHKRTCTDCGCEESESHSFGEWVEEDEHTHKRTCADCGCEETAAHAYGEWVEVDENTHKRTCADCGCEETAAHAYGEWVEVDENTHKHTCTDCGYEETEAHSFGEWEVTKEATCSETGVRTRSCLICGAEFTEEIPLAEHSYETRVVEPTFREQGYTEHVCSECGDTYKDEYTNIDIETNLNYGLACFTVVNAQTLEPIEGARIFVSTEKDGDVDYLTDEEGKVSAVLPVGRHHAAFSFGECFPREADITVRSGENVVPDVGLSEKDIVEAALTQHRMTKEEIEAAGIDELAEGNRNVVEYSIVIESSSRKPGDDSEPKFRELPPLYITDDDTGHDTFTGKTIGPWKWKTPTDPAAPAYYHNEEENISVVPLNRHFFLIIKGSVSWLKEMFDVELLVVNNSLTDTLEGVSSELSFPVGVSLADMMEGTQTAEQVIGTVPGGETRSVHWYLRGDAAGTYQISASLSGIIMPFEEVIDQTYTCGDPVRVIGEDAVKIDVEVPGKNDVPLNHPITVTVTNVADFPIYDVWNLITENPLGFSGAYYIHGSETTVIEPDDDDLSSGLDSYRWPVLNPGDAMRVEFSADAFQDLIPWLESLGVDFVIPASGTCGYALTWILDENGTLIIKGSGAMTNYSDEGAAPWYAYRDSITSVIISRDLSTIGDYAFSGCTALTQVLFLGSKLEYGKIRIGEGNEILGNVNISFGRPDSVILFNTGYNQEQYFGSEAFYSDMNGYDNGIVILLEFLHTTDSGCADNPGVPELKPVTMTAKISGSDLSFSAEGAQNTLTETYEPFPFGQVSYTLLKLYPTNPKTFAPGSDYEVTVTVDSDSIAAPETVVCNFHVYDAHGVSEHLAFIQNDQAYHVSKQNNYGSVMAALKNDAEYNWSKGISFDFGNYYDIVMLDLLSETLGVNMVSLPSFELFSLLRGWNNNFKDVYSVVETLLKEAEGVPPDLTFTMTTIGKLFSESKYQHLVSEINLWDSEVTYSYTPVREFGKYDLYTIANKVLENKVKPETIDTVFRFSEKGKIVLKYVNYGKDCVETILDIVNMRMVVNACYEADEEFKEVLCTFASTIPESEETLYETATRYASATNDVESLADDILYVIFVQQGGKMVFKTIKTIVGKSVPAWIFGCALKVWGEQTVIVAGETVAVSSTAAYSAVAGAGEGLILGLLVSDLISDAGGKAEEMSKVISMSEFAPYLIQTLQLYEDRFANNPTEENMALFESAFALHKTCQCYIVEHTAKAIETKGNSIIGKIGRLFHFKNYKEYDQLIADTLNCQQYFEAMQCFTVSADDAMTTKRKVIAVKCPVDVFITDSLNRDIVSIVNNEVASQADGVYVLINTDGAKYISVPADREYSVSITATDYGTMSYAVYEYPTDLTPSRVIYKEDIPLVPEQLFTGNLSESFDIEPEVYSLTSGEEVIPVLTADPVIFLGSGYCGESLAWVLNGQGELRIDGVGAMNDFSDEEAPWAGHSAEIVSVEIFEGVTGIGAEAFRDLTELTSVTVPASVTAVGENAFSGCTALKNVNYAGSRQQWNAVEIHEPNEEFLTAVLHYGVIDEAGTVSSGKCGDDLSWTLDDDGLFVMSGTGAMWGGIGFFDDWLWYDRGVKKAVVEEGITILNAAFKDCGEMSEVVLPSSLTEIGALTFYGCTALTDVYYGGTEEEWNEISIGTDNECLNNATVHFSHFHSGDASTVTKEATCTEDGLVVYTCSVCGDTVREKVIPALGHNVIVTPAAEPTAEAPGLTEGSYCDRCGEVFAEQKSYVGLTLTAPETLMGGKNVTVKAAYLPGNIDKDTLIWTLGEGENQYATLSTSGKLTAKKVTEAVTVHVTAAGKKNPLTTATVEITIYPATTAVNVMRGEEDVTGKTLNLDLNSQPSITISASTAPADAMDDVQWTCSDSKGTYGYMTDNGDGTATFNAATGKTGSVTLTAKAADGSGKSAKVTVKIGKLAGSIEITDAPTEMRGGAAVTLKTNLDGDKTLTDRNVVWTLSDDSIPYATLSKNKLTTRKVFEPVMIHVTGTVKARPELTQTIDILLYPETTEARIALDGEFMPKNASIPVQLSEGTVQLVGSTFPEDAIQSGTWKSSSTKIATVDENGVVTLLKAGTVTITFTADDGSKKNTAVKLVIGNWVTDISFDQNELELLSGKSATVKTTIAPADATNKKLVWSSSDPTIATVSNGKVSAKTVKRTETVTITATAADNGGTEKSFDVTVRPAKDTLSLWDNGADVTGKTLAVAYTEGLTYVPEVMLYSTADGSFAPADVTWKSGNAKIATVDENGVVTFLKAGSATITAQCGKLSAKLTIKTVVPVESVTITDPQLTELVSGKNVTLKATVVPANATNKKLVWSSSDPTIATVSNGKVTAKAVTKRTDVTITATAADGSGVLAEYTFTIVPKATGITVRDNLFRVMNNRSDSISLSARPQLQLSATVFPNGAKGAQQSVTWTSSNKKIAEIDENGNVTLQKKGTVTIKATANDGSKVNASFKIIVTE